MALSRKVPAKKRPRRILGARSDLAQRLESLEKELSLLKLNLVTAREQAALAGWHSGQEPELEDEAPDAEEQEQRLIGIVDMIWQHLPEYLDSRHGGDEPTAADPAWEMLYWEVREVLASHQLRPEVPEGAFDPALAQAVELVPADREQDHRTVQRVLKPAIVRETQEGTSVIRAAQVVVWDSTIPAEPEDGDDPAQASADDPVAQEPSPPPEDEVVTTAPAVTASDLAPEDDAPASDPALEEGPAASDPAQDDDATASDPHAGNGVRVSAKSTETNLPESDPPDSETLVPHPDDVHRTTSDGKGPS